MSHQDRLCLQALALTVVIIVITGVIGAVAMFYLKVFWVALILTVTSL